MIDSNVIIETFADDVFGIDEVTMYEGEWTEKHYAVSGDVLDGVSYKQSFQF